MLALQCVAIAFLALSAALMFGPQLVVYGPKALRDMVQDGQVQFVGGCLVSGGAAIILMPHFGDAFSSGRDVMTLVVVDIFTMQFQVL